MEQKITTVPIDKIDIDTAQPRQDIDQKKIAELAKDIKERGQLYPILVTPFFKDGDTLYLGAKALEKKGCKWFLLDGYRRVLATQLNKEESIDVIIKLELTFLEMIEIQFASNTKRVQVTVEEMAKAIARFKVEFKKVNPKKDPIKRLVELTGFSEAYFDMAEAINRSPSDFKKNIFSGKIGGYSAHEIERATKDKNIRQGIRNAYLKSTKKISALTPRALKQDFRTIEKLNKSPKEKEKLAEQLVYDWSNRGYDSADKEANYSKYLYETETFMLEIKKWNLTGLTVKQINTLIGLVANMDSYFREARRKIGKLMKTRKRSKSI